MATEMKAIVNMKISDDMNVSFQMSHVGLDGHASAYEAGRNDSAMVSSYILGYSDAFKKDESCDQ